jgi:hypothetical protein
MFLLKTSNKNKPDVVFNFVELYKEQPRLEMNFTGVLELLGVAYTGAAVGFGNMPKQNSHQKNSKFNRYPNAAV